MTVLATTGLIPSAPAAATACRVRGGDRGRSKAGDVVVIRYELYVVVWAFSKCSPRCTTLKGPAPIDKQPQLTNSH